MSLSCKTSGTLARVSAEPWVIAVETQDKGEFEQWRVRVSGETTATDRLVPTLLLDDRCDIIAFHLSDRGLEEAYLEVMGADNGD